MQQLDPQYISSTIQKIILEPSRTALFLRVIREKREEGSARLREQMPPSPREGFARIHHSSTDFRPRQETLAQ
jgi:hypothetical protein